MFRQIRLLNKICISCRLDMPTTGALYVLKKNEGEHLKQQLLHHSLIQKELFDISNTPCCRTH